MANIGSLEIPRIFLVSRERAEYFPRFWRGIQNQVNEQAYWLLTMLYLLPTKIKPLLKLLLPMTHRIHQFPKKIIKPKQTNENISLMLSWQKAKPLLCFIMKYKSSIPSQINNTPPLTLWFPLAKENIWPTFLNLITVD